MVEEIKIPKPEFDPAIDGDEADVDMPRIEDDELKEFFGAKGMTFKDVKQFEAALLEQDLTPARFFRVINRMMLRSNDNVKLRAIESVRKLVELVYGTEIRLTTSELAEETNEDLDARRRKLELRLIEGMKEEKSA